MSVRIINALQDFINTEQDAQNKQVAEMWRKPATDRVLAGEAIQDVEVTAVNAREARLRFRQNISKFRPNDSLRLSFDAPNSGFAVRCTLESEFGNELVVSPGYRSNFNGLVRGEGYTLDRDMVDVRWVMQGVLEAAWDYPEQLGRFVGILQGSEKPEIDQNRYKQAAVLLNGLGFNSSQEEAFKKAYAAENYYLVQGPPGTGKTRVLAQLAMQLAAEGERVLVTAFTHRAINNALRTIGQKTMFLHSVKIGSYKYADDLSWGAWQVNNYENLARSPFSPTSTGLIIGATVFALHTSRLKEMDFDTVIFDEAGQVTLPLALAGMLRARRTIFIGDHQQMAPVIVAEHQKEWVKRSIFEAAFTYTPGTMLDTTYRMNKEINAFPSQRFYEGQLKPFTGIQDQRLLLKEKPQAYAEILNPEVPAVFAALDHSGQTMRAPQEADLAAGLAAEACRCGLPAEEMAIVAPYRAQGRLIRQRLQALAEEKDLPELTRVVVDTVERIQGQERDLVILSLVTSDTAHAAERADFYFQPNRLNVAITRARKKLIILGSPELFNTKSDDPKIQAWIAVFRDLYEQSVVIKAGQQN